MAFGFGSLSPADDAAASPEMAAFLQARLAGVPGTQAPAPAQPQADAPAVPAIPPEVDAALAQRGLPSMSSVVGGISGGMQGNAPTGSDLGGRIGTLLGGMVGRNGDLLQRMHDGTISPGEFLSAAAGRAKDYAGSAGLGGSGAALGGLLGGASSLGSLFGGGAAPAGGAAGGGQQPAPGPIRASGATKTIRLPSGQILTVPADGKATP